MVENKQLAKNVNIIKMEVNGLTPKKRTTNSRNFEVEEFDKKISQLIYRHKTLS
jgi:hypothetical protein